MKLPEIMTHRLTKCTGLAATLCLAAAMIASYWYWPSLFWSRANSPVSWTIDVTPGGINVTRNGDDLRLQYGFNERWNHRRETNR